jgi:hypothetical protein
MIPESKYEITHCLQHSGSIRVTVSIVIMLSAIQL